MIKNICKKKKRKNNQRHEIDIDTRLGLQSIAHEIKLRVNNVQITQFALKQDQGEPDSNCSALEMGNAVTSY